MTSNPIGSTPPSNQPSNTGAQSASNTPATNAWDKPFTWGGMYFDSTDAKNFWNNMCQAINSQIVKDQAAAKKASEKLKKSIDGDDSDDD